MDRLRAMGAFVAVAEASGFAPAARRLGLSPASVTRAIGELEARLGARLLHRTTRSVRLSEAGARYLADCRRILGEVAEAERQAAGAHAAPRGLVTVSASAQFGRMAIAPILLDLLARYPALSVRALFVDRIVHLLDEGIDVAVRIADLPDSAAIAVQVGTVRRVLCAGPAYLARHGRPVVPGDLARHALIDFVNLTPNGEWAFAETRFRPRARLRVNSAEIAIAAAEAGHGITRVLSYMIAPQLAAGTLDIVLAEAEPPPVPVHVMHKEPGQTSARVRATVDVLVEALRASPVLRGGDAAVPGP